jgi:hypothetical protein
MGCDNERTTYERTVREEKKGEKGKRGRAAGSLAVWVWEGGAWVDGQTRWVGGCTAAAVLLLLLNVLSG